MALRGIVNLALIGVVLSGSLSAQKRPEITTAATKAISLIQASERVWARKQTCASCHHQWLPALLFEQARRRNLPLDEQQATESIVRYAREFTSLDRAVQNTHHFDPPMNPGFELLAEHASGVEPTIASAVNARLLANFQNDDGSWTTADARPPQSFGSYASTAISVRALSLHMPPQLAPQTRQRIARAREWLIAAKPGNTEDRAFRLIGLKWSDAASENLASAAADLMNVQRPDGGWAQLAGYSSDAYATGQALSALAESGKLATTSETYRRGLRFLLQTQKPDGSWLVRTRMQDHRVLSPPYFETGFPYGKHQIASIQGTAWAAMALVHSLPAHRPERRRAEFTTDETLRWQVVALFGSPDELRALLDNGLDPNAATPAGTTLLMMAAHDLEKVRLLLSRGAPVNAKSNSRYTALMVAAYQRGTTEIVRLLVEEGAEVQPRPPLPVSSASPLFFAVTSGEGDKVEFLLKRGAQVDRKMLVLGLFPLTPLQMSVFRGDVAMVRLLLDHGANIEAPDGAGLRPLAMATVMNNAEMIRALVEKGARLEERDNFGYTPLLRAMATDFGNDDAVKALLASGANRNSRTPAGLRAIDLARRGKHSKLIETLEHARAPAAHRTR